MSSPPVLHRFDASASPITLPNTPAISKLRSLLRQFIRVFTTDGRIFIGTFAGTDKPLNIILTNTEEFRIDSPDSSSEGRYVSLVLVPWKLIRTVEAPSRWMQDQERTTSPFTSMYL